MFPFPTEVFVKIIQKDYSDFFFLYKGIRVIVVVVVVVDETLI